MRYTGLLYLPLLILLLTFSGNSGNSLAFHRCMPFTTRDQDSDNHEHHNCAIKFKGAWWYNKCHHSNLNGLYLRGSHSSHADGVNWKGWKGHYYSLKRTEMKIRPVDFWTVTFMAQQSNSTNLTKKRVSRSSIFSITQSLLNRSLAKRCSGFFFLLCTFFKIGNNWFCTIGH